MAKPYKSIRIFQSPFLEQFTHVPPWLPLVFWGPLVVALYWRAVAVHELGAGVILLMSLLGFLSWTLAEYVLHRYIFHFSPKGAFQTRFQFIIHGMHHADPVDPTRLVMSPVVGLVLAVIFYGGFRSFMGPQRVEPFFAAFVVGYLWYDYTHYYVHHFTPRTAIGKALKQSHMLHHYASHEARWGVSSPLWDWVFGTLEEQPGLREQRPSRSS